MHENYRKALEELKFENAAQPPIVLEAQDAEGLEGYRLYNVAWWGDDEKPLPAGFTHCRVGEYLRHENAYELFLYEDREGGRWKKHSKLCEPDWLLLAFWGGIAEQEDPAQLDREGKLDQV